MSVAILFLKTESRDFSTVSVITGEIIPLCTFFKLDLGFDFDYDFASASKIVTGAGDDDDSMKKLKKEETNNVPSTHIIITNHKIKLLDHFR
mmetsp:Transcript_36102/g.55439  ORF Transcript_36102/g.55439 Transcript_36102/m.55439 type:complete len:92 (-) Transcript_36102:4-279(-)